MLVKNKTRKTIAVFGWRSNSGFSDTVLIDSGNQKEVNGPIVNERGALPIKGYAIIIAGTPKIRGYYKINDDGTTPIPSDDGPAIGICVRYYSGDDD